MTTKKNKKNISLCLLDIQETSFKFNAIYDYSKLSKETLRLGIGQHFHADIENETLTIGASINYTNDPDNAELAELSVLLNFKISDLGQFVRSTEDGIQTENDELILNLLNISFGTLRGLFYARLKGTPLEKYPIPLISKNELEGTNKDNLKQE